MECKIWNLKSIVKEVNDRISLHLVRNGPTLYSKSSKSAFLGEFYGMVLIVINSLFMFVCIFSLI